MKRRFFIYFDVATHLLVPGSGMRLGREPDKFISRVELYWVSPTEVHLAARMYCTVLYCTVCVPRQECNSFWCLVGKTLDGYVVVFCNALCSDCHDYSCYTYSP